MVLMTLSLGLMMPKNSIKKKKINLLKFQRTLKENINYCETNIYIKSF